MILLTGCTGFIGSEVFARLLKANVSAENIVLLVRKIPSENSIFFRRLKLHGIEATSLNLRWQLCDFLNPEAFQKTLNELPQDIKQICHLAAQIKTGKGMTGDQERMNQGVTEDLLHWSEIRKVKNFVYASSVVAFGGAFSPRVRKESDFESGWNFLCETLDYFRSKRRAHEFVVKNSNVPTTLICPGIVHGALESGKDSRSHLKKYVEGSLKVVPPGGGNIVGLDRVANCFVEALLNSNPNQLTIKFATDENVTYENYFRRYVSLASTQEAANSLKKLPNFLAPVIWFMWLFCHFFGLKKIVDLHSLEGAVASTLYLWFESETGFSKSQSVDNSLRDSLKFR